MPVSSNVSVAGIFAHLERMARFRVVGCGYVGQRIVACEREDGHVVDAIVRSEARCQALSHAGIVASAIDLDGQIGTGNLTGRIVYYLIPPPSTGRQDARIVNFLASIPYDGLPERIVLISTTGVYGNASGAWVDEDSRIDPSTDRARRRRFAELALTEWAAKHHIPWVILRVPGIYGPGRLPLARIRAGTPVLNENESPWSNRIHVDDLVRACRAAARTSEINQFFNVSDGQPTTMTDYFNRLADHFGLPRPPQISMTEARDRFSAAMLSYLDESRRISNARMRKRLGVSPLYPDLKSGLSGMS